MTNSTLDRIDAILLRIESTLSSFDQRIQGIEQKLDALRLESVPERPISATEATALLGCGRSTLHRFQQEWIEGVHYFKKGEEQGCLYNAELLLNWQRNRHSPSAHQIAIDQWLARQPENQRRKRK